LHRGCATARTRSATARAAASSGGLAVTARSSGPSFTADSAAMAMANPTSDPPRRWAVVTGARPVKP